LNSAKLSILINGKAVGNFSCARGVRQGDPLSPHIADRIKAIIIPKKQLGDRLVWKTSKIGFLIIKHTYNFVFSAAANSIWTVLILHQHVPPSNSFVVWRCFHNKMPTDENLIKRAISLQIKLPIF
jgi:hypothetical protein